MAASAAVFNAPFSSCLFYTQTPAAVPRKKVKIMMPELLNMRGTGIRPTRRGTCSEVQICVCNTSD